MKTQRTTEFLKDAELKELCPAIYAKAPAPEVSEKYQFINTQSVLKVFRANGWDVCRAAQTGKGPASRHTLVLRQNDAKGVTINKNDFIFEAYLDNSHNRTRRLALRIGLMRLACENGLMVVEESFGAFTMTHIGSIQEQVEQFLFEFEAHTTKTIERVKEFQKIELSIKEQIKLSATIIKKAYPLCHSQGRIFDYEKALEPLRPEDERNDLFTIANRIQEKIIKGGVITNNEEGTRERETKGVNNQVRANDMNAIIWNAMVEFSLKKLNKK